MSIKLNERTIDFILVLRKRGGITKKDVEMGLMSYYAVVWRLRDCKIIHENGSHNGQKVWSLTNKGERLAGLLENIRGLMKDEG